MLPVASGCLFSRRRGTGRACVRANRLSTASARLMPARVHTGSDQRSVIAAHSQCPPAKASANQHVSIRRRVKHSTVHQSGQRKASDECGCWRASQKAAVVNSLQLRHHRICSTIHGPKSPQPQPRHRCRLPVGRPQQRSAVRPLAAEVFQLTYSTVAVNSGGQAIAADDDTQPDISCAWRSQSAVASISHHTAGCWANEEQRVSHDDQPDELFRISSRNG